MKQKQSGKEILLERGLDLIRMITQETRVPQQSTDCRYVILLLAPGCQRPESVNSTHHERPGSPFSPDWLPGGEMTGGDDDTAILFDALNSCSLTHAEVRYNNRYVVLLSGYIDSFLMEFRQAAEDVIRSAEQQWGCPAAYVMSPVTDDPTKIHQIYRVAELRFELTEFKGEQPRIIFPDDEEDVRAAGQGTTLRDAERRLYLKLINKDFAGAESCVAEMVQDIGKPYYSDVPLLKARLFCILEIASYNLAYQAGSDDEMSEQMPQYMGSFLGARSSEHLLRLCHEYIGLLNTRFRGNHERMSRTMTEILGYFGDHFMETSTNVSAIAKHFGISPQQFSRDFRKYTGMTPSRYLKKLRIDRAEQLLTNTSLGNEQIAERVGFSTVKSLYRAMQEYEGVTPYQFRVHSGK